MRIQSIEERSNTCLPCTLSQITLLNLEQIKIHIILYINKYISTIYKYCVIWAKVKQMLLLKDCLKLLFRVSDR